MAMATFADSMTEQLTPGRLEEIERRLLQEIQCRELATKGPNDLEFFARAALRLRPKVGAIQPFVFNAAQQKLHAIIEGQKAKTGRVRVIILKARQLGVSTYVAARFFHRTIFTPGLRTIIVGHERRASSNLFQIVKRFYENLPAEVCPPISASNAEELLFDKIDSGYIVTVATTEGAGRSATAQALHASEVAFWPDLPVQMTALMQTVPDLDDTEVILETTANGFNDFHSLWRKAEVGESEFLPIFLPWTLDAAYARQPDSQMTAEEASLADLHGLNAEQIAWRRAKVSQLGSDAFFQQEYPLVACEAFISPERESFIPVDLVLRARRENVEPAGPLIVGVDPAGSGADRTAIAWRRGRCVVKVQTYRGMDTMQIAGLIAKIMREEEPALDQHPDRLRAGAAVGFRPFVEAHDLVLRQAQPDHGITAGCRPAAPALFGFSRY
jgi:hypothetical protein